VRLTQKINDYALAEALESHSVWGPCVTNIETKQILYKVRSG